MLRNFVDMHATLVNFKVRNLIVPIMDLGIPPVACVSIELFLNTIAKLGNDALKIECFESDLLA